MLRLHEDRINARGESKRGWSKSVCIGPCEGPCAFTRKRAQRIVWENHLSRLDQQSYPPIRRNGVERKFLPEQVAYASQLPFVLDSVPDQKRSRGGKTRFKSGEDPPPIRCTFGVGQMRLRDVPRADLRRLVGTMLLRGHSIRSAKRVKTVASAISTQFYEHECCRDGRSKVEAGQPDQSAHHHGCEVLPPITAAVREQWYNAAWGSAKTKTRQTRCAPAALGGSAASRSAATEELGWAGGFGICWEEREAVMRERDRKVAPQGGRRQTGHSMAGLARPEKNVCNARRQRKDVDRRNKSNDGARQR
jgi:hypothetical protein